MSEPLPDPNKRRPNSITGKRAADPLNRAPTANNIDPTKHSEENKNSPTTKKKYSTVL